MLWFCQITFIIILIPGMIWNMPKVFCSMHTYRTIRMRPDTRCGIVTPVRIDWMNWTITTNLINCENQLFETSRLKIQKIEAWELSDTRGRKKTIVEVFSCELKSKTCFKLVSPNGFAVPFAEKKYVERLIMDFRIQGQILSFHLIGKKNPILSSRS